MSRTRQESIEAIALGHVNTAVALAELNNIECLNHYYNAALTLVKIPPENKTPEVLVMLNSILNQFSFQLNRFLIITIDDEYIERAISLLEISMRNVAALRHSYPELDEHFLIDTYAITYFNCAKYLSDRGIFQKCQEYLLIGMLKLKKFVSRNQSDINDRNIYSLLLSQYLFTQYQLCEIQTSLGYRTNAVDLNRKALREFDIDPTEEYRDTIRLHLENHCNNIIFFLRNISAAADEQYLEQLLSDLKSSATACRFKGYKVIITRVILECLTLQAQHFIDYHLYQQASTKLDQAYNLFKVIPGEFTKPQDANISVLINRQIGICSLLWYIDLSRTANDKEKIFYFLCKSYNHFQKIPTNIRTPEDLLNIRKCLEQKAEYLYLSGIQALETNIPDAIKKICQAINTLKQTSISETSPVLLDMVRTLVSVVQRNQALCVQQSQYNILGDYAATCLNTIQDPKVRAYYRRIVNSQVMLQAFQFQREGNYLDAIWQYECALEAIGMIETHLRIENDEFQLKLTLRSLATAAIKAYHQVQTEDGDSDLKNLLLAISSMSKVDDRTQTEETMLQINIQFLQSKLSEHEVNLNKAIEAFIENYKSNNQEFFARSIPYQTIHIISGLKNNKSGTLLQEVSNYLLSAPPDLHAVDPTIYADIVRQIEKILLIHASGFTCDTLAEEMSNRLRIA